MSSSLPLFRYLFVTSMICSRLRLLHLLFLSSLYYCLVFIQGLHCFIIYLLRHCSVRGFHCSIFRLLRQYTCTISSTYSLFHYLHVFVTLQLCPRLRLVHLLFVTSLNYF